MMAETAREAAERGVMALEHYLTCHDVARIFGPRALAGDPEAADLIRRAAQHMRRLGATGQRLSGEE